MAKLEKEDAKFLRAARYSGGQVPLTLGDAELESVVCVMLSDLGALEFAQRLNLDLPPAGTYFDRSLREFVNAESKQPDFAETFLLCSKEIPDFRTYFKCLCEIHKRRRKYAEILRRQPFAFPEQVAPRSILEIGIIGDKELASWMTWRKWLHDLDNRSGQETGLLFEPLLCEALGGISYSAQLSPVRRSDDPSKGRQVDCLVDEDAYEFKIRVTIAMSGQGRVAEEMRFPGDCEASGYRPVLIVLDPTPNDKLNQLVEKFRDAGGVSYLGEAAWAHLESKAGPTMSTFLEQYVRRPLAKIAPLIADPLALHLQKTNGSGVVLTFSSGAKYEVERHEDLTLAAGEDNESQNK